MKVVGFLRAREDGAAFRRWLAAEHASRLVTTLGDARRIVVQTADPDDDGEAPPYDAVIELWSDRPLDAMLTADPALAARATLDVRTSEEVVAKAGPVAHQAGVTPGISQLSFIAPLDGVSEREALRHWAEHIPLALDIHFGMNRYVQDRLSRGAAGMPPWFGMAHLHFPDAAALAHGLFRSPDDVATITADVAEFVGDVATMRATEHVLKA